MSNLGLAGLTSLSAINQWISTINTNLTNSKRTGYKETRVHLSAGFEEKIGVQFGTLNRQISTPSAYFQIEKTQILDYEQGLLTPTGNKSDFALNGKGYFVVEDEDGRRYATRDGEFHFNNQGYLVSAKGLKVLSTGQDYIRVPSSEIFLVDEGGLSVSPNDKDVLSPTLGLLSGYSESLY
ncbi:MAG: flagellar hook-basal body complex protein, partial [Candidatus Sericytochromatia bacterium]